MSLSPPVDGNNHERDSSNHPYHSFSTNDPNSKNTQDKGKEKFTMGGVKKPKFRPVMNKAVNVHKIDRTQIPIVATTPTPIVTKEEYSNKTETPKPEETSQKSKSEKKPAEKPRKKEADKNKPNRQSRVQPRFLVSGESKFFATNGSRGTSGNAMDNALLISRQMGTKKEIKQEEGMEVEEDLNDDHELPAENNGPIRFPYIRDVHAPSEHANISWDEDETQVTPLELLRGVNDGELLLFALPSFLPIYTNNREYGINEEAYTHILDTKPHDYVENELMDVKPGKIGKMRVHESGRITIDVNGYIVDMNVSIPLHYQQQVVTIDDTSLNILGNVTHRLILTPNVDNFN